MKFPHFFLQINHWSPGKASGGKVLSSSSSCALN